MTMEETLKNETKSSRWQDVKSYLQWLGIYLVISLIVGLFFIKHFRHFWISRHNAPLTEYVITDTDYDYEISRYKNDDGRTETDEDYTYFLLLKVDGKKYRVETSHKLYKRVDRESITHFDLDDERFYYDKFRDKVFLGGYYPDSFYIFIASFFVLFGILFVYLPIKFAKDGKKKKAETTDPVKEQTS